MASIEWGVVGAVAVGAGVGAFCAVHLNRRRASASLLGPVRPESARQLRVRYAALLALSAFFGCNVVEDFVPMLGFEPPDGFFLLKYVFAFAIGIASHACLRRAGADATGGLEA